jgi:hypothetical protein
LRLIGVLLIATTAACKQAPQPTTSTATRSVAPAPQDGDRVCSDLGAKRVCWQGDTAQLVPRTLPSGATPAHGFRCGGTGRARTCEDRTRNASAFACGTQRCLQERPRMPDDGEWECVEISGVVFCRSRSLTAGMQAGPMDLGWTCGERRGGAAGERICVDLDADRPDDASRRHCRFEAHVGMPQRSCTSDRAPLVGDACSGDGGCPRGSRCQAGLCLPARPEPACWLDRDCGEDLRCVFGSCAKAGA